ncbi:MAG: hypothetical protein M3P34_00105 [Actinomycetota bacterium]|nr:hypothetical protein [Actinomycetota bacterium]
MTADGDLWTTHQGYSYPWEPKAGLVVGPIVAPIMRLAGSGTLLLARAVRTADRALGALNDLVDLIEESADLVHELKELVVRLEPVLALAEEAVSKVDPDELIARVKGIEQSLLNTERASINLDKTVEGSVESLPNVLSRRARRESKKIDPTRPPQAH